MAWTRVSTRCMRHLPWRAVGRASENAITRTGAMANSVALSGGRTRLFRYSANQTQNNAPVTQSKGTSGRRLRNGLKLEEAKPRQRRHAKAIQLTATFRVGRVQSIQIIPARPAIIKGAPTSAAEKAACQ